MSSAWKILFSVCFNFIVTMLIFPGAFFDQHLSFMMKLGDSQFTWYSISAILVFNILDTFGRWVAEKIDIMNDQVIRGCANRFLFVILTVLITFYDVEENLILENDVFKVINLIFFALTNGYLST